MSVTVINQTGMRELTFEEANEVGGGLIFLVPVAIFVAKAVIGSATAIVVVGAAHGIYDAAVGNPKD
ncbi:MAG: hypothetical protein JKY25_09805 [Robiginitomaculum sp.]|nr:hypothetical protein [Robiginitomaculum sp.]